MGTFNFMFKIVPIPILNLSSMKKEKRNNKFSIKILEKYA
jgi:hypothetical protein